MIYGTPPTGHEAKKMVAANNRIGNDRMQVADRIFTPEGGPVARAGQSDTTARTPFFGRVDEAVKPLAKDHGFIAGVF